MRTIAEKTPKELAQEMKTCLKNGVRIYPVPYGNNFKIVVERNGKPKPGKDIFPSKAEKGRTGVFDKIRELYSQIAFKINNPEPAKPVQS